MDDLILPKMVRNKRQAYYRQYGPTLSRNAEFDVLVGLVLAALGVNKDEFTDRVEAYLRTADEARRVAAGFDS